MEDKIGEIQPFRERTLPIWDKILRGRESNPRPSYMPDPLLSPSH